MADKCAWLIALGEVEALAQIVAGGLRSYGLAVKGQKWPVSEAQAWLASAQEASEANAGVVVLVADPALYTTPDIRRALSLFRLSLQTRLGRQVDGLMLFNGDVPANLESEGPGTRVLADWSPADPKAWIPKAVARAHAPSKNRLPVRIGLHAHERLGVWLEVASQPPAERKGSVVGVTGNQAKIDFHAVGLSGRLPDRTTLEYELRGLQFDVQGLSFDAWGVQNSLTEADSYFVRLEGEPNVLAIGELPEGEMTEVDLVRLA